MIKKIVIGAALSSAVALCMSSCQNAQENTTSSQSEENPLQLTTPEEAEPFLGRWDLTLDKGDKEAPSWLEIKLSGTSTIVGAWVGESGSSRPVSHVVLKDGVFSFAIPPQWEGGEGNFVIQGQLEGETLKGTVTTNKGESFNFTGERAPYLNRTAEPQWGEPISLIQNNDLTGWKPSNEENNKWTVEDGVLSSTGGGANLITEQTFEDFKLHAEFMYPEGSNAGVYLRGRYEVQIEDSPADRHPGTLYFGAIYGFLTPNEMVAKGPGEWQEMDVTLVGRLVTVTINGKTVINKQEIPGITGGALNSHEGEPGPIYLQGDHGAVSFRNIVITPAK